MASASNLKSHFRARSISLPSKHHPLIRKADEQLDRLRCSDAASSPSLSLASSRISCLREVYNSLDDSLLLLYSKQCFAHEECRNELLDQFLRLLDLCSSMKDVIVQTNESAHELQSALRDEFGLRNEVARYLTSGKMAKKMIKGCLKNLKSSHDFSPSDPDDMVLVSMLREAEEIALATFESLLHLLNGTKAQDKRRGWPLVSKLMHSKRAEAEGRVTGDEFSTADAAVDSLLGSKLVTFGDPGEDLKQMLRAIESSIQGLSEDLERLQRHLIKTRASLLNMLIH
ncbi:uncharacterized protein LOC115735726 [Rhodamnia argentea]|uniref:Uncharacterized protein LOC115735726 n=1 Tax=Rhodamnia argentea TaxID=178133 RepID=A0A8B8NLW3_9MYRT|nr:uncharacterized protein LOC115735726 [Rhodamnia argentea]